MDKDKDTERDRGTEIDKERYTESDRGTATYYKGGQVTRPIIVVF